jgi:hypothetical protein
LIKIYAWFSNDVSSRFLSPGRKYRTLQLKELDMPQPPSADEDDADSDEKEINETLDRIIDFLATYLP